MDKKGLEWEKIVIWLIALTLVAVVFIAMFAWKGKLPDLAKMLFSGFG